MDPVVLLGSQYYVNTDDTPEQVQAGIGAMARAGLRLVRIFLQWNHVEPRQGCWDWSQYDALFDAAEKNGLGVVVTLMAAHPPGWMRLSSGSQDIGPLEDPVYWEQARDYIRRVVARYGSHPVMHSWILWNEPKRLLPQNDETLNRFHRFLQDKYVGDIGRLNARTYQQFSSFEQVSFPSMERNFEGYTERLDWLYFSVYRLQEMLADIKKVIRDTGDAHPVHVNPHNLLGDMFGEGQSIWSEGRLADFLGCSAHPSWHSTRFLPDRLHQSVALFADLTRGATQAPNKHFWVTELQGGTNIYSGITCLGPSGENLRSWIWESLGAGAKAVVFWCFNARSHGYEGGEWSLLDQQGRPSRRLQAVSEIAAFLERHTQLFAASQPSRASVALLYSEATWRLGAVEGQGCNPENPRNVLMGADALAGAYQACYDADLSVDILDEVDVRAGRASDYAILLMPGCTALEEATLPALRAYAENGGTLLADGLCGYKDEDGWLQDAAHSPLNDIFGASIADIQAVPETISSFTLGDLPLPIWFLKIVLEPAAEVKVLAHFSEPSPRAALTVAQTGRGRAIRLGTVFFQHYFRHPAPQAFGRLCTLLPLPNYSVSLDNPSQYLRLRRLRLPDGELLLLLNAGHATEAKLSLNAGVSLWRITSSGEEQLGITGGKYSVFVEAQNAELFRASYPVGPALDRVVTLPV